MVSKDSQSFGNLQVFKAVASFLASYVPKLGAGSNEVEMVQESFCNNGAYYFYGDFFYANRSPGFGYKWDRILMCHDSKSQLFQCQTINHITWLISYRSGVNNCIVQQLSAKISTPIYWSVLVLCTKFHISAMKFSI